ncbi:MAG: hypothetical protein ACD_2C00073G0028 [uncultured bacterium (gcode 4)]|uniref:ASCH domain-containing protein n=1 Tax=uncultured bacterium (gcode 4) TaxID=1234023 RepID=K2H267_9BACT|nr:MAG: hypothetical protein ACD_2C00073G0028 [uncultured bacterium (gcode 4)]
MKTLKFSPPLPEMVLSWEKTITWRINDDKDLKVWDQIILYARPLLNEFARVEVVSAYMTTFENLTELDWDWHEKFSSEDEMYETYSRYYNVEANPKTELKVIKFKKIQHVE